MYLLIVDPPPPPKKRQQNRKENQTNKFDTILEVCDLSYPKSPETVRRLVKFWYSPILLINIIRN